METLLTETFAAHVLPFDLETSAHYAEILSDRRRAGRAISLFDAQVAAVCRQYQSVLATRNISEFAGTGVELINPWEPPDMRPERPQGPAFPAADQPIPRPG